MLKYWDGSAWAPLHEVGGGGQPLTSWYPPRPRSGSITDANTAGVGNVNAGATGVYMVGDFVPRQTFETVTDLLIHSAVYAGFGGTDTGVYSATQSTRDAARRGETGYYVLCHAGYHVPLFHVASFRTAAGGEYNGYRYEFHLVAGSNFHTSGGTNYIQTVP